MSAEPTPIDPTVEHHAEGDQRAIAAAFALPSRRADPTVAWSANPLPVAPWAARINANLRPSLA